MLTGTTWQPCRVHFDASSHEWQRNAHVQLAFRAGSTISALKPDLSVIAFAMA